MCYLHQCVGCQHVVGIQFYHDLPMRVCAREPLQSAYLGNRIRIVYYAYALIIFYVFRQIAAVVEHYDPLPIRHRLPQEGSVSLCNIRIRAAIMRRDDRDHRMLGAQTPQFIEERKHPPPFFLYLTL